MADPQNIFVSKDSVLSVSDDLDAVKPDYIDEALDSSYDSVGLTEDSGEQIEKSVSTTTINAHQLVAARIIVTEGTITIGLSGLEKNPIIEKLYWNALSSTTGPTEIDAGTARYVSFVYDTIDTDPGYEYHERFSGVALVTPNGSITNERGAASTYPIVLTVQGKLKRTTASAGS